MKAFLSHSSANKSVVVAVHNSLEKETTWLDRAEIEWGDLFLEKIADGIKSATDFVLFWSAEAAKSEWVRLELNMAFILALRQKAIRIRVVLLDKTPLPPYLEPFQVLSVAKSPDPAREIVRALLPVLREPTRSARARFVNRHNEMASIEDAVDDPEISVVWLFGFTGVGKGSLVQEALRRVFEGADSVNVAANAGTGFVELALALNAAARSVKLAESLSSGEVEHQIRLSMEQIAQDERVLTILNAQHWLDEDGGPQGPLLFLLNTLKDIPGFVRRPVFFTSTRRPHLDAQVVKRTSLIHIGGLDDEHVGVLLKNWYFSIYGKDLIPDDAKRIAPKLFGHPVAARLVAGLLGDHTAEYLDRYPRELISLRRDLARVLLQDLKLGTHAERLMEVLALAGTGLPATTIAATGFSDGEFQLAVEQCTRAGLLTAGVRLEGHPLFQEFFWHRLHRSEYQEVATRLARALKEHLRLVKKDSVEYAELLPVAFRAFALAGDLATANALRGDLSGELEATAITLYNRRSYELADKYIDLRLDSDPKNWRMRLYRARIRIRQEKWAEADSILSTMLEERPGDVSVLHARGRWYLRQEKRTEALKIFTGIIARREHVASLRDAAECLHQTRRNEEALRLLARAKARESENPYVLDLESRILEDMDQLGPAYDSALLASKRDPLNASFHNRLGQILTKQIRPDLSIPHFERASELDTDWFTPANSLASAYLDVGRVRDAEALLPDLEAKARTPTDRGLVEHTRARILFADRDFSGSEKILNHEIAASHNRVPNLGLLVQVKLAAFDREVHEFPTIADVALSGAEQALARIENLDPSSKFIEAFRASIADRRRRQKR